MGGNGLTPGSDNGGETPVNPGGNPGNGNVNPGNGGGNPNDGGVTHGNDGENPGSGVDVLNEIVYVDGIQTPLAAFTPTGGVYIAGSDVSAGGIR